MQLPTAHLEGRIIPEPSEQAARREVVQDTVTMCVPTLEGLQVDLRQLIPLQMELHLPYRVLNPRGWKKAALVCRNMARFLSFFEILCVIVGEATEIHMLKTF